MNLINFQLVTPEKTVLTEELVSLSCPTTMGQITILPGHIPLVASLAAGELIAKTQKGESPIFVSGGFVEVRGGNKVIVLADAAERSAEINITAAEEAKKRAQEDMRQKTLSGEEYARVAAALEKSLARLNVARKHSHRKNPITDQSNFNE